MIRLAFGSEVPEIAPEDLLNIPIVRLDSQVENDIADRNEEAAKLRGKADEEENDFVELLDSFLCERLQVSKADFEG